MATMTEIRDGGLYIQTFADGRQLLVEAMATDHGIALNNEHYALPDGRIVREAAWQVGPTAYAPSDTGSTIDTLEAVGDADDTDTYMAASARVIRTNCHLDAPSDYKHWACESKSPTPCPVTLPPHFGCDHQDGICQETR